MFEIISQYGDLVLCKKIRLNNQGEIFDEGGLELAEYLNKKRAIEVMKEMSDFFIENINNKCHKFYEMPLE